MEQTNISTIEFTHYQNLRRFEARWENSTAFLTYKKKGDSLFLMHTEVPFSSRGRGIGTELVRWALTDIKSKDFKIVAVCSFVSDVISKNPEFRDMVA